MPTNIIVEVTVLNLKYYIKIFLIYIYHDKTQTYKSLYIVLVNERTSLYNSQNLQWKKAL